MHYKFLLTQFVSKSRVAKVVNKPIRGREKKLERGVTKLYENHWAKKEIEGLIVI